MSEPTFDSVSINLEGAHARWLRNVLSFMDSQELPEDEQARYAILAALDECGVPYAAATRPAPRKRRR